ncbi:MAG: integrase, partial [Betaproteobacteria bacterium]|nr:integrase [Betaproteobacteria bacterium]
IEEKHQHARDALEHYRQSVKDQREQDLRRHEQQIQQMQAEMRQLQQSLIVKQDDLTRLNKEGARLVADLLHTQKSLYDQQTYGRQLAQKLEALQAVEQHGKTIEARLADKEIQVQTLKGQLDISISKEEALRGQVRDLELALATTNAKLAAQQGVVAELHTYLEARGQSAEEKSS